jgi:DNA-binding GntR family transcriptional regulator
MQSWIDNRLRGHGVEFVRGHQVAIAADRLRDQIVDGSFHPGERLSERVLCERLETTRTPLREALRVLAAEGFIELAPNRGAVVATLSMAEIEQTLAVLTALECEASHNAARTVTTAELAHLVRLQADMVSARRAEHHMDYFRLNQQIHYLIVGWSRNRILEQTYRALNLRVARYRFAGNRDAANWDSAVRDHEMMVHALQDRDGALLAHIFRSHLNKGWAAARVVLDAEFAPPAAHRAATAGAA